jgi:hypothetical protein
MRGNMSSKLKQAWVDAKSKAGGIARSKSVREMIDAATVVASQGVVNVTSGIKFTANAVSEAMDTANGGVKAFGGFHRVAGGHSLFDLAMWKNFGLDFPVELSKDFLTPNGLPLPGVQTLVNNDIISLSIATKWGSVNISGLVGAPIAVFGTAARVRLLLRDPGYYDDLEVFSGAGLSAGVKLVAGGTTANPIILGAALFDVAILINSAIRKQMGVNDWDLHFAASHQVRGTS